MLKLLLMNDNSSRFGKYIQLKFQQGMGKKISTTNYQMVKQFRVVRLSV